MESGEWGEDISNCYELTAMKNEPSATNFLPLSNSLF